MVVKTWSFKRISTRSMGRLVSMCGGEDADPVWYGGGLPDEGLSLVGGVDILLS